MKEKIPNILRKLLCIFLIIQPLLEIYFIASNSDYLFGFSLASIIRIGMILLLLFLSVFALKFEKKDFFFIGYGVCLIAYFILHHFNALNFNVVVNEKFTYSLVNELLYMFRMAIPYIMTVIFYKHKFKKNTLLNIVFWITTIISLVIIISNIFKVSYLSYGGAGEFIKGNIIDWFTNKKLTHAELASIGFFSSANQLGCLMAVLFPISILNYFEKKNYLSLINVFFNIIAMLMIGTRVTSYSWIAIAFVMLLLYFYFTFIKKEYNFDWKLVLKFLIVLSLSAGIFVYAPIHRRLYTEDYSKTISENEYLVKSKQAELEKNIEESFWLEEDEIIRRRETFVYDYISKVPINTAYTINIYSYWNDPLFYYDIIKLPFDQLCDNRYMESLLINRVKDINDNANDKWFGMNFSALRNADIYLERDFEMHYYSLGIIGVILLTGPYIIFLIFAAIYILLNYKKKCKIDSIVYCLCISIMCLCGYLSGSVLDSLLNTIICGSLIGITLNNLLEKDEVND